MSEEVVPHGIKRKRREPVIYKNLINATRTSKTHHAKDSAGKKDRRPGPKTPITTVSTLDLPPVTASKTAQALPIWPHAEYIRTSLSNTDVLVISGETGSGKSTLVPQFLLSAPWRTGRRIAVTQPRRVAAINLARRVADELGTPVGRAGPAAKVGYSVRFDDNVGKNNAIKFLTEGMLLQEMLRNPGLDEYDAIIVDEVHERSVNVDLILGFLNELVLNEDVRRAKRKAPRLKVVIMSATADVDTLKAFFEQHTPGAAGQEAKDAQSKQETTSADTNSLNAGPNGKHQVSTCFVKGRQFPVETIYLSKPTDDFLEAALKCVFQVHCKEPMPGDVLVFMTGQETIQSLQKSIQEYAQNLSNDYPKILVLPLYAALSQHAQQLIFQPPPRNTRKIILSTNIAETSLTVPGVRFVIDCGKEKRRQFRPRLGLDSLLVKPISQSSAIQRKGRAGREAAGKCWRLYTERDYLQLEQQHAPEILRCDLADAVLKMKVNGVPDPSQFPLLTMPSREAMGRALISLYQLGALTDEGAVSEMGKKMSRLPLSPALGRTLVAASEADMDCLLPVIDIVACFSTDNQVFLNVDTEQMREEAQEARQRLFRRQGDHLTLLAAVQAFAAEHTDRKLWCDKHLINHRTMQTVMDIRKQLRAQLQQARLLPKQAAIADYDANPAISEATGNNVLKCFLHGLRSNVARLVPDGSYKTYFGNQTVAIHPSSVLFGRKLEAILYNEFVFTNKTFARGVSMVQMDWVAEVLGGE